MSARFRALPRRSTRVEAVPRRLVSTFLLAVALGAAPSMAAEDDDDSDPHSTEGPDLEVLSPAEGQVFQTSTPPFHATFGGPGVDLSSLRVEVDGVGVEAGLSLGTGTIEGLLSNVIGSGPHSLEVSLSNEDGETTTVSSTFATDFLSSSVLFSYPGEASGDFHGHAIQAAGDVDQDGVADLLVGIRGSDVAQENAGAVHVISGGTGGFLRLLTGGNPGANFGVAVASVGDVDGDGVPDCLVGASVDTVPPPFLMGSARIISGADGQELVFHSGEIEHGRFGGAVTGVGDVDLDGVPDYAVGAFRADATGGIKSGRINVYSGADQAILLQLDGGATGNQLGVALDGGHDIDGDGVPDLLAGEWGDSTNGPSAGAARIFSGSDGSLIRAHFGDDPDDHMGNAVAFAGFVSGDGIVDVIVGAREADTPKLNSGLARVFSGANGELLLNLENDEKGSQFGAAVDGIGDINGDGAHDLIVAAPLTGVTKLGGGTVHLISGRNGDEIDVIEGPGGLTAFGLAAVGLGDLDSDGIPDFGLGAPLEDGVQPAAGFARVYSGVRTLMSTDVDEIVAETGGTVVLGLDAGTLFAGQPFTLVGSATGVATGSWGDVEGDLWTELVESGAVFDQTSGVLDANGAASVSMTVEPGQAVGLEGVVLWHAFAFGPLLEHTAGPVSLRFAAP